MASPFDEGFLVGILVGEGHFGGDGRQPQVTLRMHQRHAEMFRWIERTFPGGRLYGPYEHGGRRYYQWMARGPYLRDVLVPILERSLRPEIDAYAHQRFHAMCENYPRLLGRPADPEPQLAPDTTTRPSAGDGDPQEDRPDATSADEPRRKRAGGAVDAGRRADDIFSSLRRTQSAPSEDSSKPG